MLDVPSMEGLGVCIELLPWLENGSHFLMDQIDRLERPNQYFELDDLAFVVPLDKVDAVHGDTVNLDLEFKRCVMRPSEFANIPEGLVEEHVESSCKVLHRDR